MTVRPGQSSSRIGGAFTLGSATGVQLSLFNSSWAVLVSAHILFTATATIGNRTLVFRVLDNLTNILFQNAGAAVITASQAVRISLGAGLPNQSFTLPLTQIVGLPVEMPVSTNGFLQIFDSTNVDINDALTINAAFAM